jgi:carboxypeptidase Taq
MDKQKADFYSYSTHPYDALLNEFEPGMNTQFLDPLFLNLRVAIVDLLKKIRARQGKSVFKSLPGIYEEEKQREFGIKVLEQMGFDFKRGRQDKSTHPFMTDIHATDVRITTRYSLTHVMEGLSSSMHEGGHGLYEQGLDPAWSGTPFGSSASLAVHESQSRFWENVIGKRESFWKGYYPLLQDFFPDQLKGVSLKRFYQSILHVQPSLIRVESDEVTYNLHILIRYEIERDLFLGKIKVHELPEVWNEKYLAYLGISPDSNSTGVLQDVHWSHGAFGYFPTYTLGNLLSVQFFDKMKADLKDIDGLIEAGQLTVIRDWLRAHVFVHGRLYDFRKLVKKVTGKEFSEKPFVSYLQQRYL